MLKSQISKSKSKKVINSLGQFYHSENRGNNFRNEKSRTNSEPPRELVSNVEVIIITILGQNDQVILISVVIMKEK